MKNGKAGTAFCRERKRQYLPYIELKEVVRVRGIIGQSQYRRRYKEILGAPSSPEQVYEQWEGWQAFCGINEMLLNIVRR